MKRNNAIDNGKQQMCDFFRAYIITIFLKRKKKSYINCRSTENLT